MAGNKRQLKCFLNAEINTQAVLYSGFLGKERLCFKLSSLLISVMTIQKIIKGCNQNSTTPLQMSTYSLCKSRHVVILMLAGIATL